MWTRMEKKVEDEEEKYYDEEMGKGKEQKDKDGKEGGRGRQQEGIG